LAASAEFTIDVTSHAFAFQNAGMAHDVDGNGVVTPLDVLIVINWLNGNKAGPVPSTSPESAEGSLSFVDVSGDNFVSPLDALMVINLLSNPTSVAVQSAEGEGLPMPATPAAAATERSWNDLTAIRRASAVDVLFGQDAALTPAEEWDELLGVLPNGEHRSRNK
jgi:hypothetical protein